MFALLQLEIHATHLNYPEMANVRVVRVIGDFNGWAAPGEKLSPSLHGEGWSMDLNLSPGVYRYVFLPNGTTVPVGPDFEHQVNIIVIPPADFKFLPAVKGDGSITASGVLHEPGIRDVRRLNVRTYALRLRTRKSDVMDEAVSVWSDGGERKNYPMRFIGSDPLFDYFEAKVVVNPTLPFSYRFLLDDGAGVQAYDHDGLNKGVISEKPFRVSPREFKIPPEPI